MRWRRVVVTNRGHGKFQPMSLSSSDRGVTFALTSLIGCAAISGNGTIDGDDESKTVLLADASHVGATFSREETGDDAECCPLLLDCSAAACFHCHDFSISRTAHCGNCARAGATEPNAGGEPAYPGGGPENAILVFSRVYQNSTRLSSQKTEEVALHDGHIRVRTIPRMHDAKIDR